MKNLLIILSMVILFSCNDGTEATQSSDGEFTPSFETVSLSEYNSMGAYSIYNYYGVIKERSIGGFIYEDDVTLPSELTVTQDENSSLRNGDTAYIMLNNYFQNRCEYIYDGTSFVFNECKEDIAGYQVEDTINLADYSHPTFGNTREVVIMLFGRAAADLHTGIIKIEALL